MCRSRYMLFCKGVCPTMRKSAKVRLENNLKGAIRPKRYEFIPPSQPRLMISQINYVCQEPGIGGRGKRDRRVYFGSFK